LQDLLYEYLSTNSFNGIEHVYLLHPAPHHISRLFYRLHCISENQRAGFTEPEKQKPFSLFHLINSVYQLFKYHFYV